MAVIIRLDQFGGNSIRFREERISTEVEGRDATIVGVTNQLSDGQLDLVVTLNAVDFVVPRKGVLLNAADTKRVDRAIAAAGQVLRLPIQIQPKQVPVTST